jgi:hypothetical protein
VEFIGGMMKQLIEALQILLKYKDDEFPTGCEHDEFYVYVDPDLVSVEDTKRLEELGFYASGFNECFISTKYGSA